jgi:hypothetical protein
MHIAKHECDKADSHCTIVLRFTEDTLFITIIEPSKQGNLVPQGRQDCQRMAHSMVPGVLHFTSIPAASKHV